MPAAMQPVFYSRDIDYWVITRYADIKAIFRDHETYTAANTITPIVPFSDAVKRMLAAGDYSPEPVLSNNVPPSHTRIRALVNRLFSAPRRMKSFAPAIREIAQRGVAHRIDQARCRHRCRTNLRVSRVCPLSCLGRAHCRCAAGESLGWQSHQALLRPSLRR